MVRIGEVFWVASVKGADDAADSADQMGDAMGDVAASAVGAAAAQEDYGDATAEANEETERSTFLSGALDVAQSLLGSTLFFTANSFSVASAAATVYSGAMTLATAASGKLAAVLTWLSGGLTTLVGLGKGFISWLAAGSAGALAFAAAIGFAIGTLGVWILEVTGALDAVRNFGSWVGNVLPGVVVDGLLAMISLAMGPLAVFGGFISGFVSGGFDEGFRRARQVIEVFLGAWGRLGGRIVAIGEEAWNGLKEGWEGFKNFIMGGVQDILDALRGIPEAAAEAADSIPGSDVAGDVAGGVGDVASGIGDAVGLDSGGRIVQSGLAEVHKGEAVIPRPLVEAAERGPERMGGMAEKRISVEGGAGGSGGGGGGPTEQNFDIEIGDQTLDLSNVSRSTLRELASMIDSEIGSSTGNLAGGR